MVLALSAVAVAFLVASSSAVAASTTPKGNLVETAVGAGNFKTLVSLVQKAGLTDALTGRGPLTVFAPTDAAFARVPKATLDALAADKEKLRAVLLYHVAKGRLPARSVVKRRSIKTLNGESVRIRVRGERMFVGGARVVTPNVRATNGVIHVIDRVLIP